MAVAKLISPDARHLVRRVTVCPIPVDVTANASYALTYNTDSQLTQIDKVMTDENGAITYRRTLTWTGSNLTAVSTWSEV